jgi:hypothetical protein
MVWASAWTLYRSHGFLPSPRFPAASHFAPTPVKKIPRGSALTLTHNFCEPAIIP